MENPYLKILICFKIEFYLNYI